MSLKYLTNLKEKLARMIFVNSKIAKGVSFVMPYLRLKFRKSQMMDIYFFIDKISWTNKFEKYFDKKSISVFIVTFSLFNVLDDSNNFTVF